jgi:hypothetical protein
MIDKSILADIRRRDSQTRVCVDRYGGPYVVFKDIQDHGGFAILDRRALLAVIDEVSVPIAESHA